MKAIIHRIKTILLLSSTSLITTGCLPDGFVASSTTINDSINFSKSTIDISYNSSNAPGSNNLDGAVLARSEGSQYIYFVGSPTSNTDKLNFKLDGDFINSDKFAPYKMYGGSTALNVSSLSLGQHTIEAVLKDRNRRNIAVRVATFTVVQNPPPADDPPSPPPSGEDIEISFNTSNAPSSANLDGANLGTSGTSYIYFVGDITSNTDKLNFKLDGDFINSDLVAPYKMYGGSVGLDISSLSPGDHIIEAVLVDADRNQIATRVATFTVGLEDPVIPPPVDDPPPPPPGDDPPPPPPSADIEISYNSADAPSGMDLNGATLNYSGTQYIYFVGALSPDTDKLNFKLNGDFINSDLAAPYKMYDGSVGLDLSTLGAGDHTVEAVLKDADRNNIAVRVATFTVVANPGGDPPPPPPPGDDPPPPPPSDDPPPPPPSNDEPVVDLNGSVYVVDSRNGNDSNNGRTASTAWRTLGRVNSANLPTGADVLLMTGSVFENQRLLVRWGGTANNRAMVRTGYVDAGDGNKLIWYNQGTGQGRGQRAEINGTWEATCRAARNCRINNGAAVPADAHTFYQGLIEIYEDYVQLQSIKVMDSAAIGVALKSAASWTRMFDSEIGYSAMTSFRAAAGSQNTHLRNNEIHHSVMCDKDQSVSAYSDCANGGAGGGGGHPPAILLCTRAAPCGALAEGNRVYSTYGEGFSMIQGEYVHLIGNVVSDNRAACVLLDGFDHAVVEGNICYNATDGDFGYDGNSIRPTLEGRGPQSNWYGNFNTVIRNNLMVGIGSSCFNAGMFGRVSSLGFNISYKYINNSCVNPTSQYAVKEDRPDGTVLREASLINNIIYAPNVSGGNSGDRECRDRNTTQTYISNFWNRSNITGSHCKHSDDVYGQPNTVRSMNNVNFTTANPPRFEDFAYANGNAPGVGDATAQEQIYLDADDFPLFNEITIRNFDRRTWERMNAYDALGKRRDPASPDMGAVEF